MKEDALSVKLCVGGAEARILDNRCPRLCSGSRSDGVEEDVTQSLTPCIVV